MNCQRILKMLPLFIGGELSNKKEQRVQDHLDHCQSCQNQLESLRISTKVFSQALQDQHILPIDKNFADGVLDCIPQPREVYSFSQRKLRTRIAWAVSALSVGVIFLLVLIRGEVFKRAGSENAFTSPRSLPLVEKAEPGVTVMTFQTDDPKITIVWFFQNDN